MLTTSSLSIADYQPIIGPDAIDEIRVLASRIGNRRFQNVNSTSVGGGVAEILTRMIPLLHDLGVNATWDLIKGDQAFFNVTKAFHNALHGKPEVITPEMLDIYRRTTEMNLRDFNFTGDTILIHDPQPAGLILQRSNAGRHWIWRCHIDISAPHPGVWEFLLPFVSRYDAAIFSMPGFSRPLRIPQFMVAPSIDPLADKNRDLPASFIRATLEKHNLDPARPIVTQISRFDRLKDPLGVIEAFRLVRRRHACQLVLAGGGAPDDPEGDQVYQEVLRQADADPDIHVINLPPFSDLEINALVRGSTIVVQKSLREGFGLTVAEALWKRKPVIGGAVGGIRLQVLDGITGFLVHSPEGTARRIMQLLADPRLGRALGENGHLHVRQNFLITRHLKDYLLVMLALDHPGEDIVYLD